MSTIMRVETQLGLGVDRQLETQYGLPGKVRAYTVVEDTTAWEGNRKRLQLKKNELVIYQDAVAAGPGQVNRIMRPTLYDPAIGEYGGLYGFSDKATMAIAKDLGLQKD